MKKLIFTAIINLMIFNLLAQSTQSRLWTLMPNLLDFSTTPPTLTTPFGSQNYQFAHNIIYDIKQNNQPYSLFFTNDLNIYNSNGNQIGSGFSETPYNEMSIVPVSENHDTKYLVITPYEYALVEVCDNLESKNSTVTNIISLENNQRSGAPRTGLYTSLLAVSTRFIINENEGPIRILFVCHMKFDNSFSLVLNLYKISGTTITFLKSFNKTDLSVPSTAYLAGYEESSCYSTTEMEMINISNNETEKLRLAFPYNIIRNNLPMIALHVIEFNKDDFQNINTLNYSDNQVYSENICPNEGSVVHGVEFSPNGEELYFDFTSAGGTQVTCTPNINYLNLPFTLPNPSTTSFNPIWSNTITAPSSLFQSFIEYGYDGKLYLIAQDQGGVRLFGLQYPNNPLNTNWINYDYPNSQYGQSDDCNAGGSYNYSTLPSYILPDQIDGEDYEIENNYNYCCYQPQNSNNTVLIETGQNITWDIGDDHNLDGDLIIQPGATLTIKCRVHIPVGAQIIVQNTGKLVIDGGYLSNFCGEMWEGIKILGDKNMTQTPSTQGTVIVKNGGTIEYALTAIEVGDNSNSNLNGGIIQAENSTFKDCYIGVKIHPYITYQNVSYFDNCIFECTGPLPGQCYGTWAFIQLFNVIGVRFYGNTFQNTYELKSFYSLEEPPYYCDNNRGIGIFALNSTFTVQKSYNQQPDPDCKIPDGLPNRFIDLTIGIQHIVTIHDPFYFLKVLDNEFTNNEYAIITSYDDYSVIYKNLFKWDWPKWKFLNTDTIFGIKSLGQYRSQILQNEFFWDIPECNDPYWWCTEDRTFVGTLTELPKIDYSEFIDNYFHNGESDNDYNNVATFTGTEIHTCSDNPADMKLACNKYERMKYDWWIEPCQTYNYGIITQYQGDGVENEFSTTNNILQINNLAQNLYYYYHEPNLEPTSTYHVQRSQVSNINDCSVNPCSVYASSFKPELIARKSKEVQRIEISGNKLDIFPVPAKDFVFVNYSLVDSLSDAEIFVFNNFGKQVLNKKLHSNTGFVTLDKEIISTPGIYICIISNNGKISLKKKFVTIK